MDFMNNLLEEALRVIPPTVFHLRKFAGNVENEMGYSVPAYGEPVEISGSVQPVSGMVYEQLGLHRDKNHKTFFGSKLMENLSHKGPESPDIIIYESKTFEVVSAMDWYSYNGWTYVIGTEKDAG